MNTIQKTYGWNILSTLGIFAVFAFGLTFTTPAYANIDITDVTIDGGSTATVLPGATVELGVTVHGYMTENGTNDWKSTWYDLISDGVQGVCVDVPNPDITDDGTNTRTFNITAPTPEDLYDVEVKIYNENECSSNDRQKGSDSTTKLIDGLIVQEPMGSITVIKEVVGEGAVTDFSFSVNGDDPIDFDDDGSVTVPVTPGSYSVVETPVDGYTTTYSEGCSGDMEDGGEVRCVITNTEIIPSATVIAQKIVCDAESYLPDWAPNQGDPVIDEDTATDFLAEGDNGDHCHLARWNFEWAPPSTTNPGDNNENASEPWTSFSGSTQIAVQEDWAHVWIREVPSSDYIPFTGLSDTNPESAEMYCSKDSYHYDNFDRVDGITNGETYYCVAWNVPVEKPKVCVVSSDETTLVEGNPSTLTWVHPSWTTELASGEAEWIWDDTQEPKNAETLTFTKTFNVDSAPTSATLKVAADNSYIATLNGNPLTCDGSGSKNYLAVDTCTAPVVSGVNTLTFVATNDPYNTNDPKTNPGGLIFELTIDGSSCSEVPTEKETIKICKVDGSAGEGEGVPYTLGWNMTLTNGETTFNRTTDDTGCISLEVDPTDGPWTATEERVDNWKLVHLDVTGGILNSEVDPTGCTFFSTPVGVAVASFQPDRSLIQESGYTCTFVNAQEEAGPYDECRSVNLITNGSFEDVEVTANGGLWEKFTSATIGWVVKKVSDTTETLLEIQRGYANNKAAQGEQYAELDGDEPTVISQPVATENGAQYKLWWAFAPRPNTSADENELSILVNDTEIETMGPLARNSALDDSDWIHSSYTFYGDGGNVDIAFKDLGTDSNLHNVTDPDVGTFLDDVYLCKIAEPQTKCLVDGYVYDEADNSPLVGWTVGLDDISDGDFVVGSAETNSDGYYCIEETANKDTNLEVLSTFKSFFVTTAHAMAAVTNTHVVYQTLLPGYSDNRVEVGGVETSHVSGGPYGDTSVDVTLPLDKTLRVDFYNTKNQISTLSSSSGGGSCIGCDDNDPTPDGDTRGASDTRDADTSNDDTKKPDGEVEGAQTSPMPNSGPVIAGAGGASSTPNPFVPALAFFGIIASFVLLRITPVNEM